LESIFPVQQWVVTVGMLLALGTHQHGVASGDSSWTKQHMEMQKKVAGDKSAVELASIVMAPWCSAESNNNGH